MPGDRRQSDADEDRVGAALFPYLRDDADPNAAIAAVLDALTAAGWMRGHCPGCDCPDVPYKGPPPTGRLVIEGSDDAR